MAGRDRSIAARVDELAGQVGALTDRLDRLTRRVDALAAAAAGAWPERERHPPRGARETPTTLRSAAIQPGP